MKTLKITLATILLAIPFISGCATHQIKLQPQITKNISVGEEVIQQETLYAVPFPLGDSFKITQAYGGRIVSHNTIQTKFAVDISMPRCTPIAAAREGVVSKVVDGFGEGRMKKSYMRRANYIMIQHPDGAYTMYAHLTRGHMKVVEGQHVNQWQIIGCSGNSGFSSGPHLHFAVLKQTQSGQYYSVPFKFKTTNGGLIPREDQILTAE